MLSQTWLKGFKALMSLCVALRYVRVLSLALTPGPSRLGVWTKTVALYRESGDSPLKQY